MTYYDAPTVKLMTDWDIFRLLVTPDLYRISAFPDPDTFLVILSSGIRDGSQFVFSPEGKLIAIHP
jgi:hypothetical protein